MDTMINENKENEEEEITGNVDSSTNAKIGDNNESSTTRLLISRLLNKTDTSKNVKVIRNSQSDVPTFVCFLGGVREIARNCTIFEHNREILMVDCGVGFENENGGSFLLPNLSYLDHEKCERLVGLVITHGHQDHIGAIEYLILKLKRPIKIYAGAFACELIKANLQGTFVRKFKEDIDKYLISVSASQNVKAGTQFSISFINITHSIPDSFLLHITTPAASIVHTGDFKFDLTPVEKRSDISSLVKIGDTLPDLLLIDSTNADQSGFSKTEYSVFKSFIEIFQNPNYKNKMIVVPVFASSISRIIEIIQAAEKTGRLVLLSGNSILRNVSIVVKMSDRFSIKRESLIEPTMLGAKNPGEVVVLCTGTQGEENSTLFRIANGTHSYIKGDDRTVVVFSGRVIPGNEKNVTKCNNQLVERGITVLGENYHTHASGHGYADDLRWMYSIIRPRNVMPVHGTFIKMTANAALAIEHGLNEENTFLAKNGAVYSVNGGICKLTGNIEHVDIITDSTFRELEPELLQCRAEMSKAGAIIIRVIHSSASNLLSIEHSHVGISPRVKLHLSKIISLVNTDLLSMRDTGLPLNGKVLITSLKSMFNKHFAECKISVFEIPFLQIEVEK